MPLVSWTEALRFGVDALDGDHQALIREANRLDEEAAAGADRDTLLATLDRLIAALEAHVAHEAEVLARYGFDDPQAHRADDDRLIALFHDLRAVAAEETEHGLTPEARAFLAHLVQQHILKTDRPLRDFFRRNLDVEPPQRASRLQWLESFRLDIPILDADHRGFLFQVNELEDLLDSGADRMAVAAALERFAAHTRNHFAREEAFLDKAGYPEADSHKNAHRTLNTAIYAAADRVRRGDTDFDRDALRGLVRDWVVRHILFVDMQMKSYFQEMDTASSNRRQNYTNGP